MSNSASATPSWVHAVGVRRLRPSTVRFPTPHVLATITPVEAATLPPPA
ncbi:hypothetical protein QJS66_12960 [Kocuria rhizophila]|nr:hypothetical protein QJS66_12960 [Kocuria rhizophila]